jgi:hypothetical protein
MKFTCRVCITEKEPELFRDNIELLKNAVTYLEKYT